MGRAEPRKAALNRWRRAIVGHLEDFPRQYAALETAMAAFGEDFDLPRFKEAFETASNMESYNRVQAVERGVGRGVIESELCRRLTRAQKARSMIEHGYVRTSAGDVHTAACLVRDAARDFIAAYRGWIESYLLKGAGTSI